MGHRGGARRAGRVGRFGFLDRPLAETLGFESLRSANGVPAEDVALRFYREVLGLDLFHYGLWEPNDELTLEGLRAAQHRYLERLLAMFPDGARTVLDVGCGPGGNASVLSERDYLVEGLSPDATHGELFRAATGVPFHLAKFEEFSGPRPFDLILMSESAQYVPLPGLFRAVRRNLAESGSLVVSDYFVHRRDESYITRSGHVLGEFLDAADRGGLAIEEERDVTEETAPTLDLACLLLEERVLPAARLVLLRAAQKKPRLLRTLLRFQTRKLARVGRRLENLDSELFKKKRTYRMYRFRARG